MINGEISIPTLYRRFHFADGQRRDIASFIIETVSLRRWSTVRYCVLLYTDGFTSPMINGEILSPSLYRRFRFTSLMIKGEISIPTLHVYRRFHFADDQRWDIASFIIQTVSLRRWSTPRYCVLLYTDGFTSPMINDEKSMPTLCRRFHFADDQRRDTASFFIQTVSLRWWSTARYWCLLYADGFTSPMINGEISMPTLYRRFHFADDQRRDIVSFFIQTVSLRWWSTVRFPICITLRIFKQTDCDIHMKKPFYILKQSHNMWMSILAARGLRPDMRPLVIVLLYENKCVLFSPLEC